MEGVTIKTSGKQYERREHSNTHLFLLQHRDRREQPLALFERQEVLAADVHHHRASTVPAGAVLCNAVSVLCDAVSMRWDAAKRFVSL
jgi:hypothetical protein